MRPIKLEFEGINSFSEHTIIDFRNLTKSGIFGIFGDTGSGKSTILDCINFALYGRVERSKEKADIINYRCNAAKVAFEFNILNEGRRKNYVVERSIKNDKYGTHKAFLYEDGVCIADKTQVVERKIVGILGVEAEDFRKCIALPQGEFSQFVKSAPRERLSLIERLFSLSKYGDRLKAKIGDRQNEVEGKFQNVNGALSQYADVSEELLENMTKEAEECGKKLDEDLKNYQSAADECKRVGDLYTLKTELDKRETEFRNLLSKSSEMENLRKDLGALPECREVVKIGEEIKINDLKRVSLSKEIEKNDSVLISERNLLADCKKKLEDGKYPEKIEQLNMLLAKYGAAADKPEKLAQIARELAEKREEYKRKHGEYLKLAEVYDVASKKVAEAESEISEVKTEDISKLVNVKFKGAILKDEFVSNLDFFSDFHYEVEKYEDKSKFYKFVEETLASKISEYEERISNVKEFSLEDVNEQFIVLQAENKRLEELNRKLRSAEQNKSEASAAVKLAEQKLSVLKRDGEELKKRHDEIAVELEKIFGSERSDYSDMITETRNSVDSLKKEYNELTALSENKKNVIAGIEMDLAKLRERVAAVEAEGKALSEKQISALRKSGLESIEACTALAKKFESFSDAEKSLSYYDELKVSLKARITEIKAFAGVESTDRATLMKAEELKSEIERSVSAQRDKIAVYKSEIARLKERLSAKKLLLKEFDSIKKEKLLIERLKEVTKNNRFLEFIADEYLLDISSLASSTLLKLTDGRYFLTYSESDFYVGDNFNGGNLRGVNTLSGGETFLVSLSLALALSQTICSGASKSIEFFFLDEGFGTLDSTLVDTVMNALEKLKSVDFTIGVISHVEELKHRIDNKIMVYKATESHGSRVQVSC